MSWIDRYFFGVQTLQNQGATLPNVPTVNYSGPGVTTTVDTNTGIATVNITAGGGASQTTTVLANGLNSNVATGGSRPFASGATRVGHSGRHHVEPRSERRPSRGSALHGFGAARDDSQPRRVEHVDQPDPHRDGGDVLLPVGGAPRARLVWDATASSWALQLSGAHQEPHLNILNFGADPTGVAACDAAWTNLMAAAQGRIVDVPPGYYRFANTIHLTCKCHLEGHGATSQPEAALPPAAAPVGSFFVFPAGSPGIIFDAPGAFELQSSTNAQGTTIEGISLSRTSPARRRFGTRSRVAFTRTGRRAPCTRWERSSFRRRTSNRAWPSWSRA